jgi:hypothetical protein
LASGARTPENTPSPTLVILAEKMYRSLRRPLWAILAALA